MASVSEGRGGPRSLAPSLTETRLTAFRGDGGERQLLIGGISDGIKREEP